MQHHGCIIDTTQVIHHMGHIVHIACLGRDNRSMFSAGTRNIHGIQHHIITPILRHQVGVQSQLPTTDITVVTAPSVKHLNSPLPVQRTVLQFLEEVIIGVIHIGHIGHIGGVHIG